MSEWLEANQGESGQYKVLEKLSPVTALLGLNTVYYIF